MTKHLASWLPRDLREKLAALDAAPADEPSAPRPDVDRVLALARADESNREQVSSSADEPDGEESERSLFEPAAGRPPRRASVRLAVVCAIILVAGLAMGLALWAGPDDHPASSGPDPRLYGVSWTDVASRATVVFRPGTAHTADGCSGGTQILSVSGNRLRLGKQVGQAYGCGGIAAPQPGSPGYAEYQRQQRALSRFYKVLDSSPAWSIRGDILVLTAPTGLAIRLTTKGSAPLTLPGSSWVLQGVSTLEPHGVSGDLEGPTLRFDRNGTFRATDSCDELSGTAAVSGNTVTFHTLRRTYRDCPPTTAPDMKTTIDTMLASRLTFQVEDNRLYLTKPHTDGRLDYGPGSMQPYGSVSGKFLAVGGPAGVRSPRPMSGTGTVQFTNTRTGVSQTVDTTTGGAYTASLPPGRYTVAGHISSYQSSKAACVATRSVTVARKTAATADVYCQEK